MQREPLRSIKLKCRGCSVEFEIPEPKEKYENWHGGVAIVGLREHKALSPNCTDAYLVVTMVPNDK